MPARLDIAVQRNEAYQGTWNISDEDGVAINLTGMTVALQIREPTTQTLVQAGTIEVTDAAAGEITVTIDATGGNALHDYGDVLFTYELPYDLLLTDADDIPTALVAGYVIVSRGITS
jgi:hypothetical protein